MLLVVCLITFFKLKNRLFINQLKLPAPVLDVHRRPKNDRARRSNIALHIDVQVGS